MSDFQTLHPKAAAGTSGGIGGQFVPSDAVRQEAGQIELLSDHELNDEARRMATSRAHAMGSRVDEQELAQEILLEMVKSRLRVQNRLDNGEEVVYRERPYLQSIARSVATQMSNTRHPNDRKGFYLLNQAIDRWRAEHPGQNLPASERDRMADEIRMSMPPGRRASIGFQNIPDVEETSLTLQSSDGSEIIRPDAESAVVHEEHVEPVADLEDRSLTARDRKEMLWTALTFEREGLPEVSRGTISSREAMKTRATIASHGGIVRVMRDWRAGDLADEDSSVQAAFRPFGDLDSRQADEVAGLMIDHPQHADSLFAHVVSLASARPE